MTVIVAAKTGKFVTMVADSREVRGWNYSSACIKVEIVGPFLLGSAGSVRTGQLIRYTLSKAKKAKFDDLTEWTVVEFIPTLIEGVIKWDHVKKTKTRMDMKDTKFLLAYQDQLVEVSHDFSVTEGDMLAVGGGDHYALGYLGSKGPWTKTKMVSAVRRSFEFCSGVGPPIYWADTKNLTLNEEPE